MAQELSRSLRPRHVTMISIGGIIGAGLFRGSSAAIAATGPAIVLSYLLSGILILLVMRMLGQMAIALPHVRAFTDFARVGLGPWSRYVAPGPDSCEPDEYRRPPGAGPSRRPGGRRAGVCRADGRRDHDCRRCGVAGAPARRCTPVSCGDRANSGLLRVFNSPDTVRGSL